MAGYKQFGDMRVISETNHGMMYFDEIEWEHIVVHMCNIASA